MNKGLIVCFLLSITFAAGGQETRRVKRDHGNFGYLEIFHVLRSDRNVKHGPYEKYWQFSNAITQGKILRERGQYSNNKRDGIWTFFMGENNMIAKGPFENGVRSGIWEYYSGGDVTGKGNYKNDKRDGFWTLFVKDMGILERGFYEGGNKVDRWTYHYNNILVQTYDHSLDSVLQFFDDASEYEAIIDSTNTVVNVVLCRPPQYVGHIMQLRSDMARLTQYPLEARLLGLEGKVIVSFFVNEDGTTSDFQVVKDIGGNLGNAVVDAFKANTARWIPGIYKGRIVRAKYYQTVSFSLGIDPATGLGMGTISYE